MHTNPEVLALIALGEDVGDVAERQHVTHCAACSEEVADLARIAEMGRLSTASDSLSSPSPEVWRRISAELGFDLRGAAPADSYPEQRTSVLTRTGAVGDLSGSPRVVALLNGQRPPEGFVAAGGRGRSSGPSRFLALALAAALALVVGIGVGIGYERQVTKPENRVIASASLRPLPQFSGASGTAEVYADGRGGRSLVVKMTSPKPIDGTVQVWLLDSQGKATLMGTMKDGVATLPIKPGMSLFERPTVDVSDEPVADPNPGHNGVSILRGQLV